MNITPVSEILELDGLGPPKLNALIPNENNYKVLLMQPHGHVEADAAGVRNRDRELAKKQFGAFLNDAKQTQADLAVTPEYSMPWETLVETVKNDIVPAQGKLWALGCESIKLSELNELKKDLSPFALLIYEQLEENNDQFVSPLVYLFIAPPTDSNDHPSTVMLVQFKTHPMGDPDHFEINWMQRGKHIYQFSGNNGSLKLVSLICADVFEFKDHHAKKIYDRALILHIQLNPEPRHEKFCGCRQQLLGYSGDETEIICLNWAWNVKQCCGDEISNWNNIAASAWYLKSTQFDDRDPTLLLNHKLGLYYTWHNKLYAHVLFFNFEPGTYLINATKVAHVGVPGAISRRRGPQLIKSHLWDDIDEVWLEREEAMDGFSEIIDQSGSATGELKRIADRSPLEVERILALCAGKIGYSEDWYRVKKLESCVIDTSEVIRRLTFCQDTDQSAKDFRVARLKRCGRLWDILHTIKLPLAIADFKDGFQLEWTKDFPHQNMISASGKRATLIYMGEETGIDQIEAIKKKVAEFLDRAFPDMNQKIAAKQRLIVLFRDAKGKVVQYGTHQYVKIDKAISVSEFDIGREE